MVVITAGKKMTSKEFIEAKEELERLREEGKYKEFVIPNYELSEREKELDLLDRKCDIWVKTKIKDKDVKENKA